MSVATQAEATEVNVTPKAVQKIRQAF